MAFEEICHEIAPEERPSIILQTRRGRKIENEIAVDPVPEHALSKFNRIAAKHPNWKHRKPPTGIYNCFGHIWASRRTAVYEDFDAAVLKVREDDGYRTVDWKRESPVVGDIATYWDSLNPYRLCNHVGLVVCVLARTSLPPRILVLSKWDDTAGEVLHEPDDHLLDANVQLEYWTDRPLKQKGLII